MWKYFLVAILFISCKEKNYRIEQYYYKKGKNNAGTMWNDVKKINSNTYYYKSPEGFNPNYENCESSFDSVVFKIVENNKITNYE